MKKSVFIFIALLCACNLFAQKSEHNGVFYHIAGLLYGSWDLDGDCGVSAAGASSSKSMKCSDAVGMAFTGSWYSDAANGTLFVKVSDLNYDEVTLESAQSAYSSGYPSTTVTNPAAGDIFVAKKGTSYYVIKVTEVNPSYNTGTGMNTGRILFSYKKDFATNIDEKDNDNSIIIYPNPTSGALSIKAEQFIKVSVFDLQGKVLLESNEQNIDISYLQMGIYLVVVETEKGTFREKIVKE